MARLAARSFFGNPAIFPRILLLNLSRQSKVAEKYGNLAVATGEYGMKHLLKIRKACLAYCVFAFHIALLWSVTLALPSFAHSFGILLENFYARLSSSIIYSAIVLAGFFAGLAAVAPTVARNAGRACSRTGFCS
jgi:hypothetical protein